MTIKQKLWLMAATAIIALSAIIGIGKYATSQTQTAFDSIANDRIPKVMAAQEILITQLSVQKNIRDMALTKDASLRHELDNRIVKSREDMTKAVEFLDRTVKPRARAKLDDIRSKLSAVKDKNSAIKEAILAGHEDVAIAMLGDKDVYEKWTSLRDAVEDFIRYQKQAIKDEVSTEESNSSTMSMVSMITAIIAGLAMVVISFLTITGVTGSISDIVKNIEQAARDMKFTGRLAVKPDETGAVSASVNALFSSVDQAIKESNTVMTDLANGKFETRMTGQYAGDLELLKQSINNSATHIAESMSALGVAMDALKAGNFAQQLNTRAPGQYGQMLTKASEALKELHDVTQNINTIMSKVNDGVFDQKCEAQAFGDLLTMKNSVNAMVATLDLLTGDLVRMARAQMDGDLTVVSQNSFKGRFNELQQARATSTNKIREVVAQSLEASNIVSDAARQVSQGSSDLSSRVQEQATAIEQTSATMDEMASAVQANTENARKVAQLAHQVQDQSVKGAEVMGQTIDAMQSIKESSSKISDIVTLIDGIAFQTNLLALNAAVEAARAGEHGRGFAVVASEVRALAGKSAEAAKDIKNLIEDSVQRIERGTHLADQSGEMLNAITGSVSNVTTMIEQIVSASNEQSMGISQVHQAVAQIDRVTQENAALVEETTSAAESLSNEAEHLRSSMSFFNIGQPMRTGVSSGKRPMMLGHYK